MKLGLAPGRELAKLWSEEPSRVIVSFARDSTETIRALCDSAKVPFAVIGETGSDVLVIDGLARVRVEALTKAHRSALHPIVGVDA